MIEHFHEDELLAGYNPRVIRRLRRYTAPFRKYLLAAALCLLVATTGEMLIPVIIQRTIDHVVLDHWIAASPEVLETIEPRGDLHRVGELVYFREHELDRYSRALREDLRERELVRPGQYLLVSTDSVQEPRDEEEESNGRESSTTAVVEAYQLPEAIAGALLASDETWLVFPWEILRELPAEQRELLRRDNVRGLRRNTGLFLLVLLAVLFGGFGQVYLTAYVGQLVMKNLRLDLFDHTMHQHLGYLGNRPVGRLVTRVTNDVETINELFTSVLAELARNVSLMIAVLITMFLLNARLAMIVAVSMLPVVLITDIVRRRARETYRRVRRAVSSVNAYLSEYLSGMAVVQMFVQQQRTRREFNDRNESLMRANLSEMYVIATFRPIVDFLASLSTAVVIVFGAVLLNVELVSLGVLIAFINLIRRFYMPVMSISEQFTVLQSAIAGAERVFEMLDHEDRIADEGSISIKPSDVQGSIDFRDVRFAYKSDEPVLKGVSFSADPGEMVAVVGYTGSGKTTMINLLTRLWDVQEGSILLDRRDLKEYHLQDLRRAVQQIQQDVFLFDDTIRNNITLGLDVTDNRIWDACRTVQLEPFLRALPRGLDTRLEERGTNLSVGQRQLITFARVLVHDPPVLVLDEATSSIDSETERHLQAAVAAVTRGRTSLVVAHRLSTIQHADRILVLSHGELVESGTHQELIAVDGLYATLYHLQYEHQPATAPPQDTLRP